MILTEGMHNLNAERSAVCAGCEKAIQDRFLLNVLGRVWHVRCVQCSDCNNPLTEKCFSRDGKLFCREDFFRRFGTKCGGCGQGISPNDLVRRARDKVFHLKCFTCMVCRKQLSTGEELYVLDENKFICKEDYLNSKYSQGSDGEDNDDDLDQQMLDKLEDNLSDKGSSYHDDEDSIDGSFPSLGLTHSQQQQTTPPSLGTAGGLDLLNANKVKNSSIDLNKNNAQNNNQITIKEEKMDLDSNDNPKSDLILDNKENKSETSSKTDGNASDDEKSGKGGAKRRGPRTTIKAKQLETLKAAFAATPKPTRHIREQLAQETGLNMRVIQVWFQNRRSKERRMKQLSALGARRAFFRNPRRMRGMPDDGSDLMGPGFNYFPEGDFFPGPGYPGAYPGGEFSFPGEGNMNFMPPTSGPPGHPMMDPGMQGPMGHDGGFGLPPNDMLPPTSNTPDGSLPPMQAMDAFSNLPPRSNGNFAHQNNVLDHSRPGEMGGDSWL